MKKAVLPGSFDPFTLGHLDLLERALSLFDHLTLVVGHNPHKSGWLLPEERVELIQACTKRYSQVNVVQWTSALTDWTRAQGVCAIIKGLRSAADLEFEAPMAFYNKHLHPQCETLYLPTRPELAFVSSSAVRQLAALGQDLSPWLPQAALDYLTHKGKL